MLLAKGHSSETGERPLTEDSKKHIKIYEGTSKTQKNIIARQLGREYDEGV